MEQYLNVALAAAIGAIATALVRVPGQVHAYMSERVRKQDAEKQQHQAQTMLVETLRKEFWPNGGGSLRDRVEQCAADAARSLELAQEGIDVAKELRQEQFNHLEWHAQQSRGQ